ncbi:DNA repair protein RadC [Chitinophaga skermanii]|uniref:DNA repair protein RadC n=1 Tax=Chitinophaga skermanii TaxID=331697 RepID=A0A327Q5Y1_9BACT|nr:DNA repair protein RadC [Chitinophaga skermanii]RAI99858.1 DNA repair protein RadC [Chitinophaga skermanii]
MNTIVTPKKTPIKQTSIKYWPEEDKPREKLVAKGPLFMSNVELLAILINAGKGSKSAIDIAKSLLEKVDNSLFNLAKYDIQQLEDNYGIGTAKAVTILAALELGRRRNGFLDERVIVRNSADAAHYLQPLLADQSTESFFVLFLNQSQRVLSHRCLSTGGITGTVVDPKILFKEALYLKATKLLICHNHPSGSLRASTHDINITKKLTNAGKLLDIDIIDHIIVSDAGYYSFKDDGLI